jgi:hypothetical protein
MGRGLRKDRIMTHFLTAGLLLGSLFAAPAMGMEHHVALDHHGGPVKAVYRGAVDVTHRQSGSTAPAGRTSSLRCQWQAGLTVDREARQGPGTMMTRSLRHDGVIGGSRPGWCGAQTRAIAREIENRGHELRARMVRVAEQDEPLLHSELDRIHGAFRAG